MPTYVAGIDDLIELLTKMKGKGYRYVVVSNEAVGNWAAPTRRKKYYTVSFAVGNDVFAKDDLTNLLEAVGLAVFLYKNDAVFSEEFRKKFKELEGREEVNCDGS